MYHTLSIILGMALLLLGIFVMRAGLKKEFGSRFHHFLSTMTTTPLRGVIFGTIAAAVMQSSTAVSLITIGLVNADFLSFYQGIGIILGANIGTCTTVQLMATAVSKEYLIPLLFISLIVAAIRTKMRNVAIGFAGICSMFIGLSMLSDSLGAVLELNALFQKFIVSARVSIWGITAGIIMTFLCQSSSAATGVLMMLAEEGAIDLNAATYVVYGNNIGSCLSSLIVGAAASVAAKRVAVSHILLNVFGVVIFLPFTTQLVTAAGSITTDFARQVATIHTLFNVISSLVVLPFIYQFSALITWLVPGKQIKNYPPK